MERCLNCMNLYEESYTVCPHCGFVKGTLPKEAYHLYPGMILAERYQVGTVLGFGGFGVTYRAWDTKLEKMVALKEYYPAGIANRIPGEKEVIIYSGKRAREFQNGKERFLDEARNMARFSQHPNIVHVFDFFEENNTAYIVMEFLDGISLKQFIKDNGGRLDIDTAVGITLKILEALKEIHRVKIVHRDISPDNIFICGQGIIKLIDFGAARFSAGEEEKTLSIVLKPGFAPPEQYRSKSRQGPWTDIYAVGALLYRAVTGVMPEESVNRKVKDELKEPKELRSDLSDNLNHAILRAMAVDQELRFRTDDEFMEALQDKKNVRGVEEELARRKKRRIGISVVIGGAVLLAAAGSYGLFRKKNLDAMLKPASLEIWLPEEERTEGMFESMSEEFREKNSQITLDIVYIPLEEYEEKLEEALRDGEAPQLFESSGLGEEFDSFLEEVGEVVPENERAGYLFLDSYETYFPSGRKLPLGFQAPVLYMNQLLTLGQEEAPESLEEMKIEGTYSFGVEPMVLDSYGEAMGDENLAVYESDGESASGKKIEENSLDDFIEKKIAWYFSDTSDYKKIKEEMAGMYSISLPGPERSYGRFSDVFSISSEASEDEKKAAKRLLYYLLSERAQDGMAVRSQAGLPVNRKTYETYLELNSEFTLPAKEASEYRFPESKETARAGK